MDYLRKHEEKLARLQRQFHMEKLAEKMVEKLGSDVNIARETTKNLRIKYA